MRQDRFVFGSFSGMIGGLLVLLFWALPAKLLGLTDRIFYDWGMSLILYKPKCGVLDYTVGILAHVGISGTFGILFAGLIYLTSSRYLVLKGSLFGVIVWLSLLGTGTLYRMPMFTVIPARTALVTYVGSGLWGLVTGLLLGFFHRRCAVESQINQEKPIRRSMIAPVPARKQKFNKKRVRLMKKKNLG